MKRTGTILKYNQDRGYGFIAPDSGTGDLFFHVSAISGDRTGIMPGEAIHFEVGLGTNGRIQAKRVLRTPTRRRRGAFPKSILPPTVFILGLVALALWAGAPWWAFAPHAFMPVLSFRAYWADKERAVQGRQRTPEAELHMLDLLGGWPGGMLARQWFRHKNRKVSFRIESALIIAFHVIAWVAVLVVLPTWLPDFSWQGPVGPR